MNLKPLTSISSKDFSHLSEDQFFSKMSEIKNTGLSETDLKKMIYSLSQLLTDDQFQQLIKKIELNDLQSLVSPSFPEGYSSSSFFQKIKKELGSCRDPVLYFFPNLFNLLIHTFKLLGAGTREGGLWERYLVVTIICYFFKIPYYLAKLLEPFLISSLKTYSVALSSFALISSFLVIYQRYLKPFPYKISYCSNLDRLHELGQLPPSVSRPVLLDALEKNLCNKGSRGVLMVAPTGEGKSSLIHELVSSKKELHPSLQDLRIHKMHASEIVNDLFHNGYVSKMDRIREEIQGMEQKILFVIDEFAPIASDPKILKAFKEKFLDGAHPIRFIALMTEKESQMIDLRKNSPDFQHNVTDIRLSPMENKEIEELVDLKSKRTYDVPISQEVKQKIVDLSYDKDYLPGVGRAKKASRLIETAIATCRVFYRHPFQENPRKLAEDTKKIYILYRFFDKQNLPIQVNPQLIQTIFDEEKGNHESD